MKSVWHFTPATFAVWSWIPIYLAPNPVLSGSLFQDEKITPKTLQKQQVMESYLNTTSEAKFNQFVAKKENEIALIAVGATSALHLMLHWISLYNNIATTRHLQVDEVSQ